MKILIHWFLSAVAVWLVSEIVPGFQVASLGSALIAAAVIGLVNATLGLVLKVVTFPLTVMTLGLVWLIINGLMLLVAAQIVPGFAISGFVAAFFGSIVLTVVNMVLRMLFADKESLADYPYQRQQPPDTVPYVNYTLIAINTLVFLFMCFQMKHRSRRSSTAMP